MTLAEGDDPQEVTMPERGALQIPNAATKDANSLELVRVWVANKGQHVSLRTGVWDDPAAWGILLADLARHVANSYEQTAGLNRVKTLERIRAGWDAEMTAPTDEPSGQV
jgi:uncharacterized protein DUF5076